MVNRFLLLLSFSVTLIALCASCYGPIQETKEYPDIQAGERTVLLLRFTSDKANGKLVAGDFFAMGGFETGGEVKMCGFLRLAIALDCKNRIGFLSKELSKEGWFYLILKPAIYYLAFLGKDIGKSPPLTTSEAVRRHQYHREKGCQSSQDSIKRRFNGVLARFTIWSILLKPRPALGLGLLGIRPPELI